MTDDELAEIEARANAATPGPWEPYRRVTLGVVSVMSAAMFENRNGVDVDYVVADARDESFANADFIASSRTDVPALIAEIRRLQHDNEKLQEALALMTIVGGPQLGD